MQRNENSIEMTQKMQHNERFTFWAKYSVLSQYSVVIV